MSSPRSEWVACLNPLLVWCNGGTVGGIGIDGAFRLTAFPCVCDRAPFRYALDDPLQVNHMWIWILAAIVFFLLLLAGYHLLVSLGRRRVSEVRETLGEDNIRKIAASANCFGVQSEGYGQIRGNGVLAVTDQELYYLMWLPAREIRIPLEDINDVDTTKSHLGKTKARPLLEILFTNTEGKEDSVAWLVPDLEEWKGEVRNLADA